MAQKTTRKRKAGRRSSAWIRPALRWAVYLRDKFKCVYCNQQVPPVSLTLDHVYPRHDPRRTNKPADLVTACVSCNCGRRHTSLEDYLDSLADPGQAAARRRIEQARALPVDREAGKAVFRLVQTTLAAVQAKDEDRTRQALLDADPEGSTLY